MVLEVEEVGKVVHFEQKVGQKWEGDNMKNTRYFSKIRCLKKYFYTQWTQK